MLILKKPLNYKGDIISAGTPVPQGLPEKVLKNLIKTGSAVDSVFEELKKQSQDKDKKK